LLFASDYWNWPGKKFLVLVDGKITGIKLGPELKKRMQRTTYCQDLVLGKKGKAKKKILTLQK
jgi:hypothetical protein